MRGKKIWDQRQFWIYNTMSLQGSCIKCCGAAEVFCEFADGIFRLMGIHLTQVVPAYSVAGRAGFRNQTLYIWAAWVKGISVFRQSNLGWGLRF